MEDLNHAMIIDVPQRKHFAYFASLFFGILILAIFLIFGTKLVGGVPIPGVMKTFSLFTPASAGVYMLFASNYSGTFALLTIIHAVFLFWSLIVYWKNRVGGVNIPIGVNLVWGCVTFFALVVAFLVLVAFCMKWKENDSRLSEENRAARILRKAMRD